MPIQPKPGHYYETRTGEVVAYMGPSTSDLSGLYPHLVGQLTYTEDGFFLGPAAPDDNDLAKDLGTTDPRKLKKPRKAPAKKFRKVRMHFFRDGDGELCASQWKTTAGFLHNASWGRSFSQIVSEPVPQKKKA